MKNLIRSLLLSCLVVTITACGGGRDSSSIKSDGSSLITIKLGDVKKPSGVMEKSVPSDIYKISFTITAPDIITIQKEILVAGQTMITESFSILNGNDRYFLVEAKNSSGTVVYKGNTTVNLNGTPVSLDIIMTSTDTTAPEVKSVSPSSNATGVAITSAITITFSETIASTTFDTSSFTLSGGGSSISGTTAYNGAVVTWTPSSSLSYSTTYTATITTGVKDSVGNAMASTTLMGGSMQGNSLNLTTAVTTFAGTALSSGSTDAIGSAASFYGPDGITTDGTNLYVADANNQTIRKIVISTGVVTTLAGTAGSLGSTDATGTAAKFNFPQGITTDGTNLFVTDNNNYTIRKIVISTGVVTTFAGTALFSGSTDGTGTAARFNLYGLNSSKLAS